jgi:hypothetical protein
MARKKNSPNPPPPPPVPRMEEPTPADDPLDYLFNVGEAVLACARRMADRGPHGLTAEQQGAWGEVCRQAQERLALAARNACAAGFSRPVTGGVVAAWVREYTSGCVRALRAATPREETVIGTVNVMADVEAVDSPEAVKGKLALARTTKPPAVSAGCLTAEDVAILRALQEASPETVLQYDLAILTELARGTVVSRLQVLRKGGFTCRPWGDRKGEAITSLGTAVLNDRPRGAN